MKNLNELGVQEMDAKEIKNTEGGFVGLAILGAAAMVGLYYYHNKEYCDSIIKNI